MLFILVKQIEYRIITITIYIKMETIQKFKIRMLDNMAILV